MCSAIRGAIRRGDPPALLGLARHLAHRVDAPALAVVDAIRGELVARAEARKHYPRAVIERALDPGVWTVAAIHVAARANVIVLAELIGELGEP